MSTLHKLYDILRRNDVVKLNNSSKLIGECIILIRALKTNDSPQILNKLKNCKHYNCVNCKETKMCDVIFHSLHDHLIKNEHYFPNMDIGGSIITQIVLTLYH